MLEYVRQQTNTLEFILLEDGERIVTEKGTGTTGLFVNGETITGSTSKATATVLVEDGRNKYLYISSQQKFITGETFTGGTSGALRCYIRVSCKPNSKHTTTFRI